MIIEKLKNKLTLHPTIKERCDHIEQLLDNCQKRNKEMLEIIEDVKRLAELKLLKKLQEENLNTEK